MYRMSAVHFMDSSSTGEQILKANGAVGFIFLLLTVMILNSLLENTHSALMTMLIGGFVLATNATEPTVDAMKGVMFFRHPKVTNGAMKFSEPNMTIYTLIPISIVEFE
jgi:hypothetical protein